jgi:hypothetical protein
MAYEKKNGDIAVFKNKNKTKETQPDWTGDALIDGTLYRVSFWDKSPTMLTGKIDKKDAGKYQHSKDKGNAYQKQNDIDDDSIPF